jgi:hypothetical protein
VLRSYLWLVYFADLYVNSDQLLSSIPSIASLEPILDLSLLQLFEKGSLGRPPLEWKEEMPRG